MPFLIGLLLGAAVCLFGSLTGYDRDRSFYPVMLLVIASYYCLFAAIAGGGMAVEIGILVLFILASVSGMRLNLWFVVAALAAHGILDFVHGTLVGGESVPEWWPMFCLSFDLVAGAYLATCLVRGKIAAVNRSSHGQIMKPHIDAELNSARDAEAAGDLAGAFRHLERAHVLGQMSTAQHVRVHFAMLSWGVRQRDFREIWGQVVRIFGALAKTWIRLLPIGNTGGANVSPLRPMPIAEDLAQIFAISKSRDTRN